MNQIHPRCPKCEKRIDYSPLGEATDDFINKWQVYLSNKSRSRHLKDWSNVLMNECHPEIGNEVHITRGLAKDDKGMMVAVTSSYTGEAKWFTVPYFLEVINSQRNQRVDAALSCLEAEYAKESRVEYPEEARLISSKRSKNKKKITKILTDVHPITKLKPLKQRSPPLHPLLKRLCYQTPGHLHHHLFNHTKSLESMILTRRYCG